jgi:NADP-dependent 3-hydroxy acid dehydrogenase YdfG
VAPVEVGVSLRELKGRVAVVTGASSGIGRAVSLRLAEKGCALALADIDEEGLQETRRLAGSSAAKITLHRVDVADVDAMRAFVDEVVTAHGGVQIVVNNAGVSVDASLEHGSLDDLEWLVGVNFWGVVHGCKLFLPHLLASERGHIVNISSLYGLIAMPLNAGYCATKFAVRGWSEALRVELAEHGIGVTCVYPGGVATNVALSARHAEADGLEAWHEKNIRAFETMMPPQAVARVVVHAIENNRGRVLISWTTRWVDWLLRAFPSLTIEVFKRVWRRLVL